MGIWIFYFGARKQNPVIEVRRLWLHRLLLMMFCGEIMATVQSTDRNRLNWARRCGHGPRQQSEAITTTTGQSTLSTGSAKKPCQFLKIPGKAKVQTSTAMVLGSMPALTYGVAILDFNHDGWMDVAFTHSGKSEYYPVAQQPRE